MSFAGPTYSPIELAGRKVVALFDRAEARDFADVYALAQRYDKSRLVAAARAVDPGVESAMLATAFGTLDRFADTDIPISRGDVPRLRGFFAEWASTLRKEIAPDEGLGRC